VRTYVVFYPSEDRVSILQLDLIELDLLHNFYVLRIRNISPFGGRSK